MVPNQKLDLFRLMDCEKIIEKCTFILYLSMIYPKINFIFWRHGQ